MRIIFVNPTKFPRPIYRIAKGLADRGHTISILQPSGDIQRYPKWDNLNIIPLPSKYIPEIRYTIPPFRQEGSLLENLICEQGYELIHVQDYQNLTALPPIWLKHKYGIPITLVNNALLGVEWQYGIWIFDIIAKLYTHILGRYILNSYDKLFFLYTKLALQTCALLGNSIPPWEVIPIGVDPTIFYPENSISHVRAQLGIGSKEKVILFVGRLAAIKRVDLIINLTRDLLSKNIPVRTIILGGGELGTRLGENKYHKLAESMGKSIMFLGPKNQEELKNYYSLADVCVLPSRSEGLPNVLLEASVCGTPCVASDVGGISEIIIHGETGYMFPKDNCSDFVYYVEELLVNENLKERIGQQAREFILSKFNWDRIIFQYEQEFTNIINSS